MLELLNRPPPGSWCWPVALTAPVLALAVAGGAAPWSLALGGLVAAVLGAVWTTRERLLWSLCLTDALTGLANRRAFSQVLGQALAQSRRERQSCALLLLDCDHFKRINDRFGHDAGDWALCALAAALRGAVRSADLVARWGGDEFAVVLRGVDEHDLRRLGDRLRQALARAALPPDSRSWAFDLTVSGGFVIATADQVDVAGPRGLLLAADRALRVAKLRGGAQLASVRELDPSTDPARLGFGQPTPPAEAAGAAVTAATR